MSRPKFLSFFGAVISMMLFSFTAFAASLSDIRVSSALNQNLLAEVTVLGVGDRGQLAVSLAPDSIWLKTGISPLPELAGLRFSIKDGRGGQVIKIIGKRPLREPVVEFILQVKTSQGTLQRWYTLLLDPPSEVQDAATVAQVVPAEVEIFQPLAPPVLAEPVIAEPAVQPLVKERVATPVSQPKKIRPVATAAPKSKPAVIEPPTTEIVAPITALTTSLLTEASPTMVEEVPATPERASGFNRLPELQRMELQPVAEATPVADEAPAPKAVRHPLQPESKNNSEAQPQEKTPAKLASAKNSYGPVRKDETLYSIANKLRPAGVTLSQTMAAILRTNPKVFAGKPKNLTVGSQLYVPPKVVMTVLSDSEAKAFLRTGRVDQKTDRKSVATAPSRELRREPVRRRTVSKTPEDSVSAKPEALAVTRQPEPLPRATRPAVDETLPIAQTLPLEGSVESPRVTRSVNQDVSSDVPSKARAPRNTRPSISAFTNSTDLTDIPLATTYSLDYVAIAPKSSASVAAQPEPKVVEPVVVTAPGETATTNNLQQESPGLETSKPEAASEASVAVEPPSATSSPGNTDIEQQRAAIQLRAEEARKLAESARAEIERVKQRQAELVVERANQLKTASMQLEKAKADKQALEALVAPPGAEPQPAAQAPGAVSEEVTNSAPDPKLTASTAVVGTDVLATELTSLPGSNSAAQEAEPAMSGEVNASAAVSAEGEAASPVSKNAETDQVEGSAAEVKDSDTSDEVSEAELKAAANHSQPITSDAATPAATSSPATLADAEKSSAIEPEADWLAKARNTGKQAVAAVTSTTSAAAFAMNDEPAELAPTELNNFTDSNFWANYFDRLKNGKIEAHNPILWVVLLGLLLLWLLSRVTGRKEKFSEPKDYGDLDGEAVDEKSDSSVRGVAALAAGTAAVSVSKDPLGDANFHIDYGMHAQALDIVRAAKPTAEGQLSQQLLLKEADILVAQGDSDGLHMLSKQQSDNAELQSHIAALEKAAEQKDVEAAGPESEPPADTESADELVAAEKTPDPEDDPLVDDLDSLLAEDDLLMEAASEVGEVPAAEVQADKVEPGADNNLVDFNLDDLEIPDAGSTAAAIDTNSSKDMVDDNSLDFDLDSLSAELDDLSASSVAASKDGLAAPAADLEIDESLQSTKGGMIDELEELTAALGGDDGLDELDVSFSGDDVLIEDALTGDDGLDELAASLASEGEPADSLDDSGLDDDLLVEAISEPAKPAPAAAADPAAEISFGDVLSTQLDLARAYSDMGDTTEARKLLETVVERGSERQIAEANQLLKELG